MKFTELVTSSDSAQLKDFVRAWFTPGSLVVLTALKAGVGPATKRRVQSYCLTYEDLLSMEGSLDDLAYDDEGNKWDLYFTPGNYREPPPQFKRGGAELVEGHPGIWLDLDADKEGFFQNSSHIHMVLDSLPLLPTIRVETGSGGVHAYWKIDGGLKGTDAKTIGEAWLAYVREVSGVMVDHIQAVDHLLRVPGSLRWDSTATQAVLVELMDYSGPTHNREELLTTCEPAYIRYLESKKQAKAQIRSTKDNIKHVQLTPGEPLTLSQWALISTLEDRVNDELTWDDILLPNGWTCLGEDSEERRIWARPGGYTKSATTDWPESPDVMSLFSYSEETGLYRLWLADEVLTKYRVYVELFWDGNDELLVRHLLEGNNLLS